MADLTTERDTPELALLQTISAVEPPIKEGVTLYAGTIARRDADGKAVAATIAGVTLGRVERTTIGGATFDATKRVRIQPGVFEVDGPALTIADVGKRCRFTDNHTIELNADGDCVIDGISERGKPWVACGLRTLIAGIDAPDDV